MPSLLPSGMTAPPSFKKQNPGDQAIFCYDPDLGYRRDG